MSLQNELENIKDKTKFLEYETTTNLEEFLTKSYNIIIDSKIKNKGNAYNDVLDILETFDFMLFDNDSSLSIIEKKLIRIEFHGCVDKPRNGFSETYKLYKSMGKVGKFSKDDYNNLKDWPFWQICEQSDKFFSIKRQVIDYLQANSIHPASLPALNEYDFQDILFEACKQNPNDKVAHLFMGSKAEFTSYVAENHFDEMVALFKRKGVNEDDTITTLNKMHRYGITDLYMQGKACATTFETKNIRLNIHHRKPLALVKADKNNIFLANHYSNLCMIINSEEFPLHNILHHVFDAKRKSNDKEDRIIQMMLTPEDAIVIAGLHPDFQIFENLEHQLKQEKKRSIKNKKNHYHNRYFYQYEDYDYQPINQENDRSNSQRKRTRTLTRTNKRNSFNNKAENRKKKGVEEELSSAEVFEKIVENKKNHQLNRKPKGAKQKTSVQSKKKNNSRRERKQRNASANMQDLRGGR